MILGPLVGTVGGTGLGRSPFLLPYRTLHSSRFTSPPFLPAAVPSTTGTQDHVCLSTPYRFPPPSRTVPLHHRELFSNSLSAGHCVAPHFFMRAPGGVHYRYVIALGIVFH